MLHVRKHLAILAILALSLWPAGLRADESTRAVQEELRRRHLFYGNIDGRESSGLTAALKRYQERKGFRQTGVADAETVRSMGLPDTAMQADLPDVPVLRSDGRMRATEQGGTELPSDPSSRLIMASLPSQTEMHTFLREYLDACQAPNVAEELAFFAPQVAYFDRGVVTKTYIRNEVVAYRQRWPERSYTVGDKIDVGLRGDKLMLHYPLSFMVANSSLGQKANGNTQNTMLLSRGTDEKWEIASLQEERVRPTTAATTTKHRRNRTRTGQDPVGRTFKKVGRTVRKFFN